LRALPAPSEPLANGVRVVRLAARLPWVAAAIWWQAGSRHEPAARAGVAHCLEHLWLARAGLDARIDALGGRVNAETGRELCGIHGVAPVADAAALGRLLAEAFLAPLPDDATLAAERPAIAAELAALQADRAEQAVQRAVARCWAGQPAARAPEGAAKDLTALTLADLAGYRERLLHGGRVCLVLLGQWPDAAADELVAALAQLPPGERPGPAPLAPAAVTEPVPACACHLVWALPADTPQAAILAAELLAGGLASRLFRCLRREQGRLYDIHASTEQISGGALCLVAASAAPGQGEAVAAAVEAELDDLARHGPAAGELAAARRRLHAATALQGLAPEDSMRLAALAALDGRTAAWPADLREPFRGPRTRVALPA